MTDLETGSECYMSEMLDFDFDEDAEADESTDEDLIYLKDPCININLVVTFNLCVLLALK